MMLGTSSNTYTAPGITSPESKSYQSGPLEVVTSDSGGNLATDGGAIFKDIATLRQGVAMAMALPDLTLPAGIRYGLSAGVGLFDGEEAVGIKGVVRINDWMQLGVGIAAANGSSYQGQNSPAIVGGNAHVKFLFK